MKDYLQDLKIAGRPLTKNELKINELQQRIDNAIKYIKEHDCREDKMLHLFIFQKKELLEILGDKENEI